MAKVTAATKQRIQRIQTETERLLEQSGAKKVNKTITVWKTSGLTYRQAQIKAGKAEKAGVLGASFRPKAKIQVPNSPKPKNKKK